jgi:hypothetical protein
VLENVLLLVQSTVDRNRHSSTAAAVHHQRTSSQKQAARNTYPTHRRRQNRGRRGVHFIQRGRGSAPTVADTLSPPHTFLRSRSAYLFPPTPFVWHFLSSSNQTTRSTPQNPSKTHTAAEPRGKNPYGSWEGRRGCRRGAGGCAAHRAEDGPALRRLRAQG